MRQEHLDRIRAEVAKARTKPVKGEAPKVEKPAKKAKYVGNS